MSRLPRLAQCICAAIILSAPAPAQLVPVDGSAAIPIAEQHVTALVEDGLARTTLRQTFVNPHERPLEAIYAIRLPEGASIVELAMEVGGQRLEGLLAERRRARRVYDDIVRAERDPALVEQIGASSYRLSVFPVVPHEPTVVELSWIEHLPLERGAFRYTLPLGAEPPPRELVASVTLRSAVPFTRVNASREDAQLVRRSPGEVLVSLESGGDAAGRALEISAAIEVPAADLAVRSHGAESGGGWFLALVTPPAAREDQLVPRDVVLVLDTSGSMGSERKLEHAKRSALWLLRNLRAADRVNVLRFSSDVEAFAERPVLATPENVARLEDFVRGFEALGSTALGDALAVALSGEVEAGRARTVVLLTDGRPTMGEHDPAKLIALARSAQGLRIHPFGVGADVDAGLLRGLAAAGRGRAELFLPGSEIEARLTGFLARTSAPVITDLEVEVEGVPAHDLLPRPLPDVFLGEQVAVTGRYREGGRATITVRGRMGDEPCVLRASVELPREPGGSPSAMQLHARAKLAHLEDARRLRLGLADDAYYAALDRGAYSTADEIVQEMIAVSLESGVQCAYTSFLALLPEDRARLDPRDVEALEAASRRARRLVGGEAGAEPVLRDAEISDHDEGATVEGDPDFLSDSPFDDRAFNDVIGVGGGTGGRYAGRSAERREPRAISGSAREKTLSGALALLVARQATDGSWDQDVGATGLALLALLGNGHTTRTGLHRSAVVAGVKWLRDRQAFESGRFGSAELRAHALATLAVAEAYFFSKSPLIRGTAQKAVNHVVRSLAVPGERDAGTLGWTLLALEAARRAGLDVDPLAFESVPRALAAAEGPAASGALVGWGLLSGRYRSEEPAIRAGAEVIAAATAAVDSLDPEARWWAASGAWALGGAHWASWSPAVKPHLFAVPPAESGSVERIALHALCLELHYRSLRCIWRSR